MPFFFFFFLSFFLSFFSSILFSLFLSFSLFLIYISLYILFRFNILNSIANDTVNSSMFLDKVYITWTRHHFLKQSGMILIIKNEIKVHKNMSITWCACLKSTTSFQHSKISKVGFNIIFTKISGQSKHTYASYHTLTLSLFTPFYSAFSDLVGAAITKLRWATLPPGKSEFSSWE